MTDEVQFDDENAQGYSLSNSSSEAFGILENLVITTGLAKNQIEASRVLIFAAVVIFILAGIVFWFFGGTTSYSKVTAPPGNVIINTGDAPPRLQYPVQ